MNVLVIEDDNRTANLVERALTEDGHRVAISHNGREGTHMLLSGRFDAALLDILLPEMDGFDCGQPSTGSIVPPNSVFDFAQGATGTPVKPCPNNSAPRPTRRVRS
jgi:DNA-binding LytR/AlgR family response regulator